MRVLDCFSGIGGFSLGLERAGMRTVAFCECDPFCRAVLNKHWPDVPCYDDVTTLTAARLAADGIADIDIICGGFPCQDISVAGKGAGLDGKRSGLWSEFARIIGDVGPRYVIIENVSVLTSRGLVRILCDLAALGYVGEWHCIPASAVGAPHRRDRIWIIAHADLGRCQGLGLAQHGEQQRASGDLADRCGADGWRDWPDVADAGAGDVGLAGQPRLALGPGTLGQWAHAATTGTGWWATEPPMGVLADAFSDRLVRFDGRTAKDVPNRVQKLKALGNALVPAIPEIVARSIIEFEKCRKSSGEPIMDYEAQ